MNGDVKKKPLRPRDWAHFFDSRHPAISRIWHPVDSAATSIDIAHDRALPTATSQITLHLNPSKTVKHAGDSIDHGPIRGFIAYCFIWSYEGA
jgi:hypothetical protein